MTEGSLKLKAASVQYHMKTSLQRETLRPLQNIRGLSQEFFAVRQGKPLSTNLRKVLLGKQPRNFRPQHSALALISSGDRYAIGTKAGLVLEGRAVWLAKDWIDRRWMRKYSELPEMKELKNSINKSLVNQDALKEISAIAMRCGGCGAKVGSNVLNRALSDLSPVVRKDIVIGLHESDDAAVVKVSSNKLMVHTVDYFRSFIDDPYIFGQIAANHSLSDLFAMGAEAQSALAVATIPFGIEAKVENTLTQLMAGATLVLNAANTSLVGGHTSEGEELGLGFSVNGLIDKDKILCKGGMNAGDVLVLTKALGTGTIFAADMQRKAKGRWIEAALDSMLKSNQNASRIILKYGATACTDVTGFGLLGHLVEMLKPSGVDAEVHLKALPVLEGAIESLAMGIMSSLQPANLRLRRAIRNVNDAVESHFYPLIFDPQTSGGLLASIPAKNVDACINELIRQGFITSSKIGYVRKQGQSIEPITLIL